MNFPGGGGPHKVEWRIGEGGFRKFRTCVDCISLDFGMWVLVTVRALQI